MPGRRFLFARHPPLGAEPVEPPADGEIVTVETEQPPLMAPTPGPPPRVPPQRERRELARIREREIRDVGGLAVEMARRSDWRYPLLESRCAEVLALEERIHELDAIMAAGAMVARGVPAVECQCGAPILRGAHFCSHCGRPAPEAPAVASCSHCGQPLPAEANFCSVCGNTVVAEAFEREIGLDDTMIEPLPPLDPPREPQ